MEKPAVRKSYALSVCADCFDKAVEATELPKWQTAQIRHWFGEAVHLKLIPDTTEPSWSKGGYGSCSGCDTTDGGDRFEVAAIVWQMVAK